MGISFIGSVLVLAQPYFTKLVIDEGLIARDFESLLIWAGAILVVGIVSLLLSGVNRYWHMSLSGKILFDIREKLYQHLQKLSPTFYIKYRTGDILSRLDGDVAEIQRFALDGMLAFTSSVIGLIGAMGLLFWLNSQLAIIAVILLPIDLAYLRMMRPRVELKTRGIRERSADLSSFMIETTVAMKYIQTVAAEPFELKKMGHLNRLYLSDLLSLNVTEFFTSAIPSLLNSIARTTVFIVGGYQVIQGQMALGSLIAFLSYLTMAVGPVQTLLGLYVALRRASVSLDRVREMMETPEDVVKDTGTYIPQSSSKGEIVFDRVSFRYPDTRQAVIENASITVPGGAKVGIYGRSGIGKTTLIDLLLRHYDPSRGAIRVDGVDLRDYRLTDWRRIVGVVEQDITLFRGSLLDNLRYAQPEASLEDVREAIEKSHLTSFVHQLPQGIDTDMGERGAKLSGGERQRLAIARVLLQKPDILVFDEATSSVDRETEQALMEAIDILFSHKTRLIISHHEQPLKDTDFRLTIRAGQIIMDKS